MAEPPGVRSLPPTSQSPARRWALALIAHLILIPLWVLSPMPVVAGVLCLFSRALAPAGVALLTLSALLNFGITFRKRDWVARALLRLDMSKCVPACRLSRSDTLHARMQGAQRVRARF